MMGAGIAYVQAMAGIETVLIDTARRVRRRARATATAC
jgi:3-hydroxyacyl-CoA dehydrogenase